MASTRYHATKEDLENEPKLIIYQKHTALDLMLSNLKCFLQPHHARIGCILLNQVLPN